jgi:hypothetical protein
MFLFYRNGCLFDREVVAGFLWNGFADVIICSSRRLSGV